MQLKKIIKPGGYVITAACLVLVGLKVCQTQLWRDPGLETDQALGLILTGSGVFAFNCLWLALAWCVAVNSLGRPRLELKAALAVYGRSWLAKYLPGNVFHFAGRQILGRRAGLSHGRLALGLVYEATGQTSVAGLLALLGLAAQGLDPGALSLPFLILLVLAAPLAWWGLRRLAFHPRVAPRLGLETGPAPGGGAGLWAAPLLYIIYYLVQGATAWLLLGVLTGAAPAAPPGYVISLFALGWVAGYVTPGAPAGLGVREAVLVLGLSPFCGQPTALLAALYLRLMSLGGDVLFYFFSRFIPLETEPVTDRKAEV